MAVYFAEAGGYIKIGYSHDPIARAVTITRSGKRPADLPFNTEVDLIGWVPGSQWHEGAIHAEHIDARVEGEWFRLDREHVHSLIWRDPRGFDLHRMSATAVLYCREHPELTRDQIESAGVRILAATDAEVDAVFDELESA